MFFFKVSRFDFFFLRLSIFEFVWFSIFSLLFFRFLIRVGNEDFSRGYGRLLSGVFKRVIFVE